MLRYPGARSHTTNSMFVANPQTFLDANRCGAINFQKILSSPKANLLERAYKKTYFNCWDSRGDGFVFDGAGFTKGNSTKVTTG